ncbi:zinc-dependent metalloprotease [Flavobacterium tibetense]|uniref:Propanediol utilization protein n=1 Tax=Flavobacterium tibetense TaxID=2233533 RepID=A0A365P3G3_9FLAO|nr:zinc-dependent metalloprotease family protein [Flavobacterium tibetense]RBA29065.1 propanediol utilization protein [Flavobacterium tibetense]
MKKTILLFSMLFFGINFTYSQSKNFWSQSIKQDFQLTTYAENGNLPSQFTKLQLDLNAIVTALQSAPDRFETKISSLVISFPDAEGNFEDFMMFEASNFEDELKAKFPQINSYIGVSLKNKATVLRLSVDPRGLNGMILRGNGVTEFFTPMSTDGAIHAFYKSDRNKGSNKNKKPFTCATPDEELNFDEINGRLQNETMASDGRLLTFRTAVSCTGEYAQYHGGTVAGAMAAINTTMTRNNGLYERDLAIRMVLIGNNDLVVYTNPATDPYTTNYNNQLQTTLTNVIGEANYDVGHLFVFGPDNGNAGCIGCVCNAGKGSAFTAADPPEGETFDVDYVAHEFGHQFGGRHTFSHASEGPNFAQKEVGGGTTIMAYAGITAQNAALASDDYFHAASIQQVQANMVAKTCPTSTPITHGAPVVNAGVNYTIPISTPFMLTGSATDVGGGSLTYCWEQYDTMTGTQTGAASAASPTKASGPNFRSYSPTTSPTRYFPNLNSVFNGSTTTAGSNILVEALSSVARTLNFRLTVKDNELNGGQTNFADMVVTVDGTRGPLTVTSQNTAGISYDVNTVQTVSWTVNNTNLIAGGANVDVLITTDNGQTWTTLLANTPNTGSANVTMPSAPAPFCRLMVKASNNIFFNVNSQVFAVGYTITTTCNSYTNNTALNIPDGVGANASGPVVSKSINVTTPDVTISSVRATLGITHTWMNDLVISLEHPDATQVTLFNRNCGNSNGIANLTFSDGNAAIPAACAGVTGTYSPATPLSAFGGKSSIGTWRLLAADFYNGDTGNIGNWTLEICTQQITLNSDSFEINNLALYPNPNNGSFTIQFSPKSEKVNVIVHDIRGRQIFERSYTNTGLFNENINLSNVQSGVYMVTVLDGAQKQVKKIVIQ